MKRMKSIKENIGATKTCVCPNCGYSMERPLAIPCFALRCPRCGTAMQG